ncbi:hypothetical protein LJC15_01410 [Desulfovibrio sp. OttesenSCG-928-G11]|nr:hypothetical protein [Desulfovibrio sp. OttesenSCG-928-G11]
MKNALSASTFPYEVVLTVEGETVGWSPYKRFGAAKRKRRGAFRGTHRKSKSKKARWEALRRRRLTRLLRLYGSLKVKPAGFITLRFDWNAKRDWTVEKCQSCLGKFLRWLQRNFPKCWFIHVMEVSDRNGYHYHIMGRLGQKRIPHEIIREKWLKITSSSDRESVDIRAFETGKHIGYVTKPRKARAMRQMMGELGKGRSFWGYINKKNMKLYPPKSFLLSRIQMHLFRASLAYQLVLRPYTDSSLRRLFSKKHTNFLGFCTREEILAALEFVGNHVGEAI